MRRVLRFTFQCGVAFVWIVAVVWAVKTVAGWLS